MHHENAKHADDDRGPHHLRDREIAQQKLANQDVIFAHSAFLQKESEDRAEDQTEEELSASSSDFSARVVCRKWLSVFGV